MSLHLENFDRPCNIRPPRSSTTVESCPPSRQEGGRGMQPTTKDARIAALLYLLMALPGPFCLLYIPRTLIVAGNPAATASNVVGHEMLFRSSIVLGLVSCIFFL